MEPFGLKSSHFTCLFFLHHEGRPLTAAEISELSAINKAAISRSLADLAGKGYICCPAPAQKRKYRAEISLTEAGRLLSEKLDHQIDEAVSSAGAGLTDEERSIFYKSLLLISSNLQELEM